MDTNKKPNKECKLLKNNFGGFKQRINSPFPLPNRMKKIYFLPPDL